MGDDIEIGPIDFLIVEWPAGTEPKGEALPALVDLVDRGVIRILDLAFIRKQEDGGVTEVDINDFDLADNPDLGAFVGARSGLLDDGDFAEAGSALDPGSVAGILVYENAWAGPFAAALRRGGAVLVDSGRVPINAIIQTLDQLEAAEA